MQPAKTTRVTIVVLPDSSMMTFSSVIDPLRAANRFSRMPLFSWKITSLSGQAIKLSCGIEIAVDSELKPSTRGDLLILVAGFRHQYHAPARTLPLLRQVARQHHTIFGIEAGTWVLARAEIIRAHKVTTHWEDLENLSFSYPGLDVVGQRYVIDQNIWTSGGASPALDMLLHYLRTTQNRSLAMDVASAFIYKDISAPTDAQTIVSPGRIQQTEPRLAEALEMMQESLEEPLPVSEIAARLGISNRTLELISNKHLGASPGAYYLRLRLQAARRLVLDTNISMLDISVRTGFNNQAGFTRAFKKRYGQSPLNLRNSAI